MIKKLMILLFGLLFLGVGVVSADTTVTRTVCPNGCDHTTIQAAINAASDGDLIQILMTSPHTEPDIVVNKSLTIEGLGTHTTFVQAADSLENSTQRVFTILSDYDVTLRNFRIQYGNPQSGNGGGLLVPSSVGSGNGHLQLDSVWFWFNHAEKGGGMYVGKGQSTLNNVSMRYNDATYGGGLYSAFADVEIKNGSSAFYNSADFGGGVSTLGGSLTVGNSYFQDNTLNPSSYISATRCGGGATIYGGTVVINNSSFRRNEANTAQEDGKGGGLCVAGGNVSATAVEFTTNEGEDGGAIYLADGSLDLDQITLAENSVEGNGGAILQAGGNLMLSKADINTNSAAAGGAVYVEAGTFNLWQSSADNNSAISGGGIYQNGGTQNLTNSTVSRNEAGLNGGGIYINAGLATIANTTIAGNIARVNGGEFGDVGGLYFCDCANSTVHLNSTIIADNIANGGGYPDCLGRFDSAYDSLIENRGANNACAWERQSDGMVSNVSAGLNLISGEGYARVYSIAFFSPAIDAGNCDDAQGGAVTHDQRGLPAPVNGDGDPAVECDMGSYEFNSAPTAVGISQQGTVNNIRWPLWSLLGLLAMMLSGARMSSSALAAGGEDCPAKDVCDSDGSLSTSSYWRHR